MSFLYFQLTSLKWEKNEINQKTPMFLSNDAIVTFKNQESLLIRDEQQLTRNHVECAELGDSQPWRQSHLQSIYV